MAKAIVGRWKETIKERAQAKSKGKGTPKRNREERRRTRSRSPGKSKTSVRKVSMRLYNFCKEEGKVKESKERRGEGDTCKG